MEITRRSFGTLMRELAMGDTLKTTHLTADEVARVRRGSGFAEDRVTLARTDRLMESVLDMKKVAQDAPATDAAGKYLIPLDQLSRYPSVTDTIDDVQGTRTFGPDGQVTAFHMEGPLDNYTLAPAERKGTPVGTLYRMTDPYYGDITEVVDHPDGSRTLTEFQYSQGF